MTGVPHRLAAWLVSKYPEPWRRRYHAEVLTLLADSGVRWRDAADLARGLAVERPRALVEPGRRPALTLALVGTGMWLTGLGLALTAYGIGRTARLIVEPASARWAAFGMLMIVGAVLATAVQYFLWVTRSPAAYAAAEHPATRGAGFWMGITLVGVAVVSWAHPLHATWSLLLFPAYHIFVSGPPSRWQRARAAVLQIAAAKHQMKWALREFARCERLAAEGTPSPLAEARETLARIHRSREDALGTLNAMGYRARFERGEQPKSPTLTQ